MPVERYRLWKAKDSAIGCVFARYMAVKPTEFGQRSEVIYGSNPTTLAGEIDVLSSRFVEDPAVIAAAFVLPDVKDLQTLVNLALGLSSASGWNVTRSILSGTPGGDVVAFNITRDITKEGDGTCPSEALILGPFRDFPNTRLAPVTALELFVGVATATNLKGQPRTKAHLADVPLASSLPAATVFQSMWSKSEQGRLTSLGGVQDERAKAKVAFAIPLPLAVSMGVWP